MNQWHFCIDMSLLVEITMICMMDLVQLPRVESDCENHHILLSESVNW